VAQQVIMDFVTELARTVELPEPIVEFGSLQVEPDQPNDLRRLLGDRDFTGTDIRPGPGVDRVEDLRGLSYQDAEIGTALCLDTLEHCEDPRQACREIHRVLAPGGLCVITSVMLFPIHGYPNDYWRFTPEGFRVLLEPFDDVDVVGIGHPEVPTQVIGVGRNGDRLGFSLKAFETLTAAQNEWARAEGKVRIGVVHVPLRQLATTLAGELPRVVRERAKARLNRSA
jgi:SAM-dependent methyltransferase